MRRALIAAAVTSGLVAAGRRRHRPPAQAPAPPAVPRQRSRIVEGDAELSVALEDAQDERILALLDRL